MALITAQPTANQSPDPGQGGLSVTSPTNTGHASTQSTALDLADSEQRTCIWTGFSAVTGQIQTVTLKIDHTSSGGLTGIGANNGFTLDYSLNGGGAWTNAVTRTHFTASQGPTTFSVALSPTQDLTQVRVRDSINASSVSNGE